MCALTNCWVFEWFSISLSGPLCSFFLSSSFLSEKPLALLIPLQNILQTAKIHPPPVYRVFNCNVSPKPVTHKINQPQRCKHENGMTDYTDNLLMVFM